MKRTPLKRTAGLKRGTSELKRTTPMRAKAAPKFKSRKPAKTAEESRYLGRAAALGCALCRHLGLGPTPAEMHHPRTGTGAGTKAPHTHASPLCPEHHRGNTGVHGMGRKAFDAHYGITELELRDMTHRALGMVPA
jgi:hypothetical protein